MICLARASPLSNAFHVTVDINYSTVPSLNLLYKQLVFGEIKLPKELLQYSAKHDGI